MRGFEPVGALPCANPWNKGPLVNPKGDVIEGGEL